MSDELTKEEADQLGKMVFGPDSANRARLAAAYLRSIGFTRTPKTTALEQPLQMPGEPDAIDNEAVALYLTQCIAGLQEGHALGIARGILSRFRYESSRDPGPPSILLQIADAIDRALANSGNAEQALGLAAIYLRRVATEGAKR
jgi:hypothetical protein